LTIVKGFVEAHGGWVSVENRPGGGALFILRLPRPEKPPIVEAG
jgi:signal transduction histidine kinase